jgi:hypothetical protein
MINAIPRHKNDCMAVSLASVLEIPIEEIPDFFEDKSYDAALWYAAIQKWLKKRGYHLYYTTCRPIQFAQFQTEKSEPDESWPPHGYWFARIARVEWIVDNEIYHVCVMKNHRCVYNPGGTVKGTKDNDIFLLGYYLLVPIDPAKFQHKEG